MSDTWRRWHLSLKWTSDFISLDIIPGYSFDLEHILHIPHFTLILSNIEWPQELLNLLLGIILVCPWVQVKVESSSYIGNSNYDSFVIVKYANEEEIITFDIFVVNDVKDEEIEVFLFLDVGNDGVILFLLWGKMVLLFKYMTRVI